MGSREAPGWWGGGSLGLGGRDPGEKIVGGPFAWWRGWARQEAFLRWSVDSPQQLQAARASGSGLGDPRALGGRAEKHFAQWRSQKEGVAQVAGAGRAEKHRGGALPRAKAGPRAPWLGTGYAAASVTAWALER